ncbi:helix-turn-helix domain-containing protein [Amycolatopsis acidicola]|uniref:Helix-turn-helix domain-containing protein n=1 Tax=Amycolatopsis acidicola TaxID=2596893 RepID=A0A5N0UZF9_9PSEU|nr:helix-turn-helix transcriptional regulator [Amycolatopsis acidicola]KAA9159418.1 helix-turn-helix domain-containing protein [Amycolatopsis acidicola]
MDNRAEVRDFLVTRRARIRPEQAGLPVYGQRRVPGLRRDEVATLARMSPDYYTRLEKGNLATASDNVLDAIATALQLDDAERAHLFDLARAARDRNPQTRRRAPAPRIRPSVQHLLESMTESAAFVRNGRMDILAVNALGRALWAPLFDDPTRPPNLARFAFLDPRGTEFYANWPDAAKGAVALLRTEAGRVPHDKALTALVGELATRSDEFRDWWATHDVQLHCTGAKRLRHPVVGELSLTFNALDLPADPGLTLTAYTAEPGSPDEEKLRMLSSWAATENPDPSRVL